MVGVSSAFAQEKPEPEVIEKKPTAPQREEKEPPSPSWFAKQIQCTTPEKILEVIKRHGEKPMFMGQAYSVSPTQPPLGTLITFFFNPVTLSWSIVEVRGQVACLLSVGRGIQFLPLDKGITL